MRAGAAGHNGIVVTTHKFTVGTRGQGDAHDVTARVARAVEDGRLKNGTATVFVVGSTAAITTIEFEPGAIHDFNRLLEALAPRGADYEHHKRWGDDNGSSHVRAALVGPSLTVPVVNSRLTLGEWQQILLLECDTRARRREIVVQLVGEHEQP